MKGIFKKWALFFLMFIVIDIGDKLSHHLFNYSINTPIENLIMAWVAFYIALKTLEEKS